MSLAQKPARLPVQPRLSPDHLMSAPLPDLLVELDAELYDSSITDQAFFGCAIQRRDGHVALAMPAGRDEVERDTVARILLGKVLGIQLAPLPRGLLAEVSDSQVLANGQA